MDIIKGPMSLVSEDGAYSLDLNSRAPAEDMAIESYPCEIVWKHKKFGTCRLLAVYPSWSIAMWVLFRVENFFPNGASIEQMALQNGARHICVGYGVLAQNIVVPKIKLTKAAQVHAAVFIASEGLANFSHRIMLNKRLIIARESTGGKVGELYCKKKYDDDGNVTQYTIRFRSLERKAEPACI